MAFKDKSGKNFNSKFRASKSDRESAVKEGMDSAPAPKGNRSQANAIEGKGSKAPAMDTGAGDDGGPVNASAAGTMQAKAKEVHITHSPEGSHVHTVMDNGMEEHTDHPTREEAHFHGAMAAGANEGNYPAQHEPPKSDGAEPDADDDYDVPSLD